VGPRRPQTPSPSALHCGTPPHQKGPAQARNPVRTATKNIPRQPSTQGETPTTKRKDSKKTKERPLVGNKPIGMREDCSQEKKNRWPKSTEKEVRGNGVEQRRGAISKTPIQRWNSTGKTGALGAVNQKKLIRPIYDVRIKTGI